jgi:endonuclease G
MLASEDRQCSASANKQTFFMTNMHPQLERFNGYDSQGDYVWLNAEKLVRSLYQGWNANNNALDTIYAVKGGTIDKQEHILAYTSNNNSSKIIVPRYFYMAILYRHHIPEAEDGYEAIALWIPHTEGDTTSGKDIAIKYAVSIDSLEEKTGIDFFCNLPDYIERDVESKFNLAAWGWNP